MFSVGLTGVLGKGLTETFAHSGVMLHVPFVCPYAPRHKLAPPLRLRDLHYFIQVWLQGGAITEGEDPR